MSDDIETEIESSKEVIKSLQFSIETIMKNTMYRDDLVEYKIKDICDFISGKIQTSKIEEIENLLNKGYMEPKTTPINLEELNNVITNMKEEKQKEEGCLLNRSVLFIIK